MSAASRFDDSVINAPAGGPPAGRWRMVRERRADRVRAVLGDGAREIAETTVDADCGPG